MVIKETDDDTAQIYKKFKLQMPMYNRSIMESSWCGIRSYLLIVVMLIMSGCKYESGSCNHITHDFVLDSIGDNDTMVDCRNPKIGNHIGHDTIIGNFTGQGLDSIWIVKRIDTVGKDLFEYNYHTMSSNSLLPSVELYGRSSHSAFLINEGDLDGDGKDEWAWTRGNFRSNADMEYHVLHFDGDKWMEFSIDLDVDTRTSGIDIVRKGPGDCCIIRSFLYWPEVESTKKVIGYDTIFNPFRNTPMLSGYDD